MTSFFFVIDPTAESGGVSFFLMAAHERTRVTPTYTALDLILPPVTEQLPAGVTPVVIVHVRRHCKAGVGDIGDRAVVNVVQLMSDIT